jgi:hypothetical protein
VLALQNSSTLLNDAGYFLQSAIQMLLGKCSLSFFAIRFGLWGELSSQPVLPLPEASVEGLETTENVIGSCASY